MPRAAATSTDSRLVLEFPADGAYRVAVTSFRAGETGAYRLAGRACPPPMSRSPRAGRGRSRSAIGQTRATARLARGRRPPRLGRISPTATASRARRGQRVRDRAHRRQDRHLSDARAARTAPRTPMTTPRSTASPRSTAGSTPCSPRTATMSITVTSYRPGRDRRLSAEPRAEPGPPRQIGVPGGAAGDRPAGRRLRLWRADQQSAQHRRRRARALQQPARRRPAPSGEPAC